jgi:hypothetical protein
MTRFVTIIVLLLAPSLAWSATQTKVTGLFTDMHYISESGDVLGTEIFIIYSNSGYYAVMQCAEGAPSKPVVVNASIIGNKIKLQPHNDPSSHCPMASFIGQITPSGLRGKFEGTDYTGLLKHQRSYWQ